LGADPKDVKVAQFTKSLVSIGTKIATLQNQDLKKNKFNNLKAKLDNTPFANSPIYENSNIDNKNEGSFLLGMYIYILN